MFPTSLLAATVYDNNTPPVDSLNLSSGDYEFARTDSQYVVNHLTLSGANVKITGTGGNQIENSLVLSGGQLDLNGHNETLATLMTASGSATGTLTNSNNTTTSCLTLQMGYNAYGEQYQGIFSGNLGLKITGGAINDNNSIIIINRNNTYSGGMLLQGAIRVSHGSVLDESGNILSGSLGTGTLTMDGGTLQNNGNRTGGNLNPIDIANNIILTFKGGTFIAGWGQNRTTYAEAHADGNNSSLGYKCYITLSGKISDAAGESGKLTIGGDGGWTVLANSGNEFSGNTVIGDGSSRLAITANNALSSKSILEFQGNGYIDLYGHNATAAGLFGNGNNGHVVNSGNTVSTLTLSSTETVDHTYNGVLNNLTLEVDYGTGSLSLGGDVNNEGTTVVVKSGTVDLNKSAHNAAPNLTVEGGTVRLTGSSGNQISDNSGILTMDGGTFDLYGKMETIPYLRQTISNANAEITNTQSDLARLTLSRSTGQTSPYYGKITGNLELVLVGGTGLESAHLMINAENTYSGGTTIQNGWARLCKNGILDDGNLVAGCFGIGRIRLDNGFITNNGGNRPGGVDEVIYLDNAIEIAAGGGGLEAGWGSNKETFAEAVTDAIANAGKRENHWYMVVPGKISDAADATMPGNLKILKNGAWTVFANAENNYSGITQMGGGVSGGAARLAILGNGALSPNSVVEFVESNALLDMYGYHATVAGLTGDGGSVFNSGNTGSTLTIATRAEESYSWNGTLKNQTSPLSLTIAGAGTQTLTGMLSYTGNTVIESGTFVLDTTLETSEVVLAGGQFSLGANGNYRSTDTIRVVAGNDDSRVSSLDENVRFSLRIEDGGIFSPGDEENHYGISTFAAEKALFVEEGGKIQIDLLNTETYDSFTVDTLEMASGGLLLNIDSEADWSSLNGLAIGTIGNLSDLDISTWLSGWQETYFNLSSQGNQLYLNVDQSAVPEPGSWILMLLGLAVLGYCKHWVNKESSKERITDV